MKKILIACLVSCAIAAPLGNIGLRIASCPDYSYKLYFVSEGYHAEILRLNNIIKYTEHKLHAKKPTVIKMAYRSKRGKFRSVFR